MKIFTIIFPVGFLFLIIVCMLSNFKDEAVQQIMIYGNLILLMLSVIYGKIGEVMEVLKNEKTD